MKKQKEALIISQKGVGYYDSLAIFGNNTDLSP